MPKTETVRIRIEPKTKTKTEAIFKKLGISPSEAVNIFYNMVQLHNGIPFELKIPNETTLKVFDDTDKKKNLKTFGSVEKLLSDLKK